MLLVHDTTLYFQESGKGESLFFIHGAAGDANVWDEQVLRLAQEFRCVTYDRRGHTRSPLGKVSQSSVRLDADDAAEVIAALGLAPAIVVGVDRGAEIGLDLAWRHPRVIAGAVLVEPAIGSLAPAACETYRNLIMAAIRTAPTPTAAVDAFFRVTAGATWDRLPEARHEAARANHAALLAALSLPGYNVIPADLRAISVPVRIIRVARSAPCVEQVAAVIAECVPRAELITLDAAGPLAYMDQPELFAEAIRSFARRLRSNSIPGIGR